jgi:sugar (pentulose or hexulose) kinase
MRHALIFDIGKTNKKAFVLDEDYRIVLEKTTQLPEATDDDGDPCEDIFLLKKWIEQTATDLKNDPRWDIRAIHCATYGASLVHLGADGQPVAPLYNYLKAFPADLEKWFLATYGPAEKLSRETASPWLGCLNSGLQLLWLKHRKPLIFNKIKYALHLPQWVAHVASGAAHTSFVSDPTSLGCHTLLWHFEKKTYHEWAVAEGITDKLAPLAESAWPTGLHDSSAALIPYLASFREPFLLLSTGTWCIALNPFNHAPLTADELAQDCLCYLTSDGTPVKAARYFGGHEHEMLVKKLAAEHDVSADFFQKKPNDTSAVFEKYEAEMVDLVQKQVVSVRLALGVSPFGRIFVDGGFSKNETYLRLLAAQLPGLDIFAAEVAQATALGAALAIHTTWNTRPIPKNLISLKKYTP